MIRYLSGYTNQSLKYILDVIFWNEFPGVICRWKMMLRNTRFDDSLFIRIHEPTTVPSFFVPFDVNDHEVARIPSGL